MCGPACGLVAIGAYQITQKQLAVGCGISFKQFINEIDDFIITGGILLPFFVWLAYAMSKRRCSLRSIFVLTLAEAIALTILGPALVRELF
jgi:hypothetical protein